MIIQPVADIAEICYQKGVQYVVISPGSRSAHLTISFARHPHLKKIIVPDERSAAYIALGLAQQGKTPVALICTSGTAAINFYPAIAESYYQNVPLLVLTADRPAAWIDKNDGQTIRQTNLYQNHIKRSYTFPESFETGEILKQSVAIVNEAINLAERSPRGPVHINVPIKEPFYPSKEETIIFSKNLLLPGEKSEPDDTLPKNLFDELDKKRVIIVAGQWDYDKARIELLDRISLEKNIPVFSDIISNTFRSGLSLIKHDTFINPKLAKPDILITFGRSIISKKLKLFLRHHAEMEHWHVSENDYPADTFLSLVKTFHLPVNQFLQKLAATAFTADKTYPENLAKCEKRAEHLLDNFLQKTEFGEFKATKMIMDQLPETSLLHLANSMAVRYANIINTRKKIEVFSNRGTSGIDGCISTAVGHALGSEKMNVVLTGDMAFFYDRNALWHNHDLRNLRIIILNNHGGGIFRLIDGPSSQPELEEYFETRQQLNARNTASDFGMDYYLCSSEKDLNQHLSVFFEPSEKGKILEIETNRHINQKVFSNYKSLYTHEA